MVDLVLCDFTWNGTRRYSRFVDRVADAIFELPVHLTHAGIELLRKDPNAFEAEFNKPEEPA